MEKTAAHFKKLAFQELPDNYVFYCQEMPNELVVFCLKKANITSNINEFPIFMDDAFFLEHLNMQKQAIDYYEKQELERTKL